MSWSAAQYVKFEEQRSRPVEDLLSRVAHRQVASAADLGCGPGNSTELLRRRFPNADLLGLDSSADMILAARKRLPEVRFETGDISTWDATNRFDLVLANAVLQWVPDHVRLLPKLLGKLQPGGSLAVQMPDNLDEPAHRLMRETAAAGPWAAKLAGATRPADGRHEAEWYYFVLHAAGAAVDVWRTTYHHSLEGGVGAVIEWFKGSALRPFLDRLDASESVEFLTGYQAALAKAYPVLPDGSVLLPFPRLFFIATL